MTTGVSESAKPQRLELQIYEPAIETLMTINTTNHLEKKAAIVEKSILTAIRAYN